VCSMETVDCESLGLIEEFIAQAEVGAVTHHKYRVLDLPENG
jgi:hypothetical protein